MGGNQLRNGAIDFTADLEWTKKQNKTKDNRVRFSGQSIKNPGPWLVAARHVTSRTRRGHFRTTRFFSFFLVFVLAKPATLRPFINPPSMESFREIKDRNGNTAASMKICFRDVVEYLVLPSFIFSCIMSCLGTAMDLDEQWFVSWISNGSKLNSERRPSFYCFHTPHRCQFYGLMSWKNRLFFDAAPVETRYEKATKTTKESVYFYLYFFLPEINVTLFLRKWWRLFRWVAGFHFFGNN